jgi:hypothetical protein
MEVVQRIAGIVALEPHDLALSKLVRNSPIDRHDVRQLARAVPLNADILRARYRAELRPIIIGAGKAGMLFHVLS